MFNAILAVKGKAKQLTFVRASAWARSHQTAMFKKILVAKRGVLAEGKAKQIVLACASVQAMSRETAYV